jgi:predicted ArsR family transcriptional regulator
MPDKRQALRSQTVKATIRCAVLDQKTFSIAQICAQTGLHRDQIYHELAQLKKDGFLTSQPLHLSRPDTVRSARRPENLYQLTSDPIKLYQLAEGMPLAVVALARRALETIANSKEFLLRGFLADLSWRLLAPNSWSGPEKPNDSPLDSATANLLHDVVRLNSLSWDAVAKLLLTSKTKLGLARSLTSWNGSRVVAAAFEESSANSCSPPGIMARC